MAADRTELEAEVVRLKGLLDASEAERAVERRTAADEHARLTFELGHRVKNTLSVVQALANQSLREPATRDEGLEAFGGRILALSRANDSILKHSWTTATLRAVTESVLLPFGGAGAPRLTIDGPEQHLPASGALAFAMALHEMAVNATRFGAWSTPDGRVALSWGAETGVDGAERLVVTWRETGGPATAQPERKGFGLRLIEQSLRSAFGRDVALAFKPAGLVCTARTPLSKLDG